MKRRSILAGACMLVCLGRAGAEWMTVGADAQRSFWIPSDFKISRTAFERPGFQFLWKVRLNNDPVQLNSLTPAVLIDRYIGYRGFRSLAFVGGSSNALFAIDTDLARIEWQNHLQLPSPAASPGCPAGLTANLARATAAAYPASESSGGGLGGRGGAARSDAGEPGEGAVTIAPALAAAARAAGVQNRPQNIRPAGAVIYALSGDGMLRTVYLSNGVEPGQPVKYLPPNSNARGLIIVDNIAYASTQSCNGGASAIWALDLASGQVNSWKPDRGAVAGSAGPAFGPDGTVYAATTSGQIAGLDRRTLEVKQAYTAGDSEFWSSPVVFPYKGKNLVAAATKDGRIHLLDGASLGHALSVTAAAAPGFDPGAFATWQAADGTRWLLAPVSGSTGNGAVVSWKVIDHNGAVALEPGWTSRDMMAPQTPIIINGVVFALASGEFRTGDATLSAALRAQRSAPAVLYALDGATGKVLWDSGKIITSFVHSGGLSGQASQLYLETYDQTLYAFGFPIEH